MEKAGGHLEDLRSHRKEREGRVGAKQGQTLEASPGSGHHSYIPDSAVTCPACKEKAGCSRGAVAGLVLGDAWQQDDPSAMPTSYPVKPWL